MVVSTRFESPIGRRTVRPAVPTQAILEEPCATALSAVVLSGDEESRRRIRSALFLAGWSDHGAPIDVRDLDAVAKRHHQLLVVDLVHPLVAGDARMRRAAGLIARRPGTLLVTCGEEDAAEQEAWARCHAAFCHLAGAVSSATLVSVLEQAREVAERVSPSIAPAA